MVPQSKLDSGAILIHKKVLSEIVYDTVNNIDGVRLSEGSLFRRLLRLFKKDGFPGIKLRADKKMNVRLDLKIIVRYGFHIPDIARLIQESIREAIEKTADINLKEININIQGVERGQKWRWKRNAHLSQ